MEGPCCLSVFVRILPVFQSKRDSAEVQQASCANCSAHGRNCWRAPGEDELVALGLHHLGNVSCRSFIGRTNNDVETVPCCPTPLQKGGSPHSCWEGAYLMWGLPQLKETTHPLAGPARIQGLMSGGVKAGPLLPSWDSSEGPSGFRLPRGWLGWESTADNCSLCSVLLLHPPLHKNTPS